jgi:hypothetical protein
VILLVTQLYALMISLPFALSSSRSEIHRSVARAGAAMYTGFMLNAALRQWRDK